MYKTFLLFVIFTSLLNAQNNVYTNATLDVNNIVITFSNSGMLNDNYGGAYWNNPWIKSTIVFNHSIGLSGKINNIPVTAFSQWQPVLSPGPILNGRSLSITDSINPAKYGIYKVSPLKEIVVPGSYTWPADFGAPVKNGYPYLHGDQMTWTVFGFDTTFANNSRVSKNWNEDFAVFPVEVQQLTYAHAEKSHNDENILNDVIFIEYTVINKGIHQIDSFYISLWTDIDIDPYSENNFGIDTSLQTGYLWGGELSRYLAVGYMLVYGPVIESPGSSSVFKGQNLADHKNFNLSSYHPIGDDSDINQYSAARSTEQAWNISRGFKPNGEPWTDPVSGNETKFPFAGNPTASDYFWINPHSGGGAGFIMFTGPFTLAANDTQWVMLALVPAYGESNSGSIGEMKRKIQFLRNLHYEELAFSKINYDSLHSEHPFDPIQKYSLEQNYPNPFNPYTNFTYSIPENEINIPVTLKIYDILGNEIAVLVNETKNSGEYTVRFYGDGLASGIYLAELKAGNYINIKKITLLK